MCLYHTWLIQGADDSSILLQAVMNHFCLAVWLKRMTLFPNLIVIDSFGADEALFDDSVSVRFNHVQPLVSPQRS